MHRSSRRPILDVRIRPNGRVLVLGNDEGDAEALPDGSSSTTWIVALTATPCDRQPRQHASPRSPPPKPPPRLRSRVIVDAEVPRNRVKGKAALTDGGNP